MLTNFKVYMYVNSVHKNKRYLGLVLAVIGFCLLLYVIIPILGRILLFILGLILVYKGLKLWAGYSSGQFLYTWIFKSRR